MLHNPAASHLKKEPPGTHWIGSWAGPGVSYGRCAENPPLIPAGNRTNRIRREADPNIYNAPIPGLTIQIYSPYVIFVSNDNSF